MLPALAHCFVFAQQRQRQGDEVVKIDGVFQVGKLPVNRQQVVQQDARQRRAVLEHQGHLGIAGQGRLLPQVDTT